MRPQHVIRVRHDVLEEDKTATFSHGVPSGSIGGAQDALFFIGLEGSGRRALAQAAAARLGLAYAEASTRAGLDALLALPGQAVAVTDAALGADPDAIQAMRARGKVFHLMGVAPILARNLGRPDRLEELADLAERYEPLFMSAAHFVIPPATPLEEAVEDVAEKSRL